MQMRGVDLGIGVSRTNINVNKLNIYDVLT